MEEPQVRDDVPEVLGPQEDRVRSQDRSQTESPGEPGGQHARDVHRAGGEEPHGERLVQGRRAVVAVLEREEPVRPERVLVPHRHAGEHEAEDARRQHRVCRTGPHAEPPDDDLGLRRLALGGGSVVLVVRDGRAHRGLPVVSRRSSRLRSSCRICSAVWYPKNPNVPTRISNM